MRFVIKPADTSFAMMLETGRYQRIWKEHRRGMLQAFRNQTGLAFQQRHITARVTKGSYGNAGSPGTAMILPGGQNVIEEKAITLVHELSHRLLGGNALGPVALGLIPDTDQPDPRYQLFEHRHVYLFLYDVVKEVFGDEYAERCERSEPANDGAHYQQAWSWAMSMPYEQRQKAVRRLAAHALPRSRWHEMDGKEIPPKDSDAWFKGLAA